MTDFDGSPKPDVTQSDFEGSPSDSIHPAVSPMPSKSASMLRRIFSHPLHPGLRLFLAISYYILIFIISGVLLYALMGDQIKAEAGAMNPFRMLFRSIVVVLAYFLMVKLLDNRSAEELSVQGAPLELFRGGLTGAGIVTSVIFILWLAGNYQITLFNSPSNLGLIVVMALTSGFTEEILFRGVIFRYVEMWGGTWIGLLVSALLFGFIHSHNPNASFFSSLCISLEAGILLGAAYTVTRRLWLPIGMHIAWNFTLGGIFGAAVSGMNVNGLVSSQLKGSELITGGAFGPEASIITLLIGLVTGVCFLYTTIHKGNIVLRWGRMKHQRTEEAASKPGSVPLFETAFHGAFQEPQDIQNSDDQIRGEEPATLSGENGT